MNNIQELMATYEEKKHAIAALEKEIEALKPEILKAIPQDSEVAGTFGVFKVQSRATWKYSEALEIDRKALKEKEKAEQAKGIAKATHNPVLYYVRNEE